MNWYPIQFAPIYKERVWGGRRLEKLYGRALPGSAPIGESWEVTDRAEGISVVKNGARAGQSLREMLEEDAAGVMGDAPLRAGRFPLLVKTLDAREVLSLQVHPPTDIAASLGGEPKTEMWYFTGVKEGSEILVGLRRGTTREEFERRLSEGSVASCFHRVPVHAGDAMFLPSGRVHALGAGVLLFEIQESSDTTYRVFDWNRKGLDGKPRPLHVPESLASIHFADFEPGLIPMVWRQDGAIEVRSLVDAALFRVEARRGKGGAGWERPLPRCVVVGVADGELTLAGGGETVRLRAGDFCLLPAGMGRVRAELVGATEWLTAEPGDGRG